MRVVIQCASNKQKHAGYLRAKDNRRVSFVAQPGLAPPHDGVVYARPDDLNEDGVSWRDVLKAYNEKPESNPLGLLPTFELYANRIYRALVDRFGLDNTYILSAGWGLIPAAFLTPAYDITFSSSAPNHVRRRRGDRYHDFSMLSNDAGESIFFIGSKEYVPLFVELTKASSAPRTIFYNSKKPPVAPGCHLEPFETRTRTNWQYECAHALLRHAR